eukprot:CAMPEP_0181196154 /NCGR_PEP_ID=MMETSP1096-20121128/15296_1 /TAXON_ID=156174 ORGANISM="Chrysochromulina ericina, Strain CCMP281" /NCGR_SAMPLE_ID=MMETSP1096 /ASSEMBLY_ACC=CAM_ASM_000453 /LENGTH=83 /DNA_ID=CAMNT_0023285859 /DNA_START=829 /DNA_END=1077 /DNA_ORIENTATION=+
MAAEEFLRRLEDLRLVPLDICLKEADVAAHDIIYPHRGRGHSTRTVITLKQTGTADHTRHSQQHTGPWLRHTQRVVARLIVDH